MIIKLEKNPSQEELEVLIKYSHMNQTVEKLKRLVESVEQTIKCSSDLGTHWVNCSDIYYIESVDKHTFIYCENTIYQCELRLYQLLEHLSDWGFIQVSKSCLLNIHYLKSIKPLINSRLEATLCNGERIYVTRKYLPIIRQKLERR